MSLFATNQPADQSPFPASEAPSATTDFAKLKRMAEKFPHDYKNKLEVMLMNAEGQL